MNNEKPRTIDVPLSFLSTGRYSMTTWEDGPSPTALNKKANQKVGASDTMKLTLAGSGGAVARFVAER